MVTIQTVELDVVDFPAPRGDFLGPYVDWDQNNFQHEIYVKQAGTNLDDSTTLFYVKKNPQGQVVDSANLQPRVDVNGKAMKYVHVTGVVKVIPPNQSVATLVVSYSIHGAGPNSGRRAARGYHKIPGVYAPHPRGEKNDELYDVVLPDVQPEPDPVPGQNGVDEPTLRKVLGIGQDPADPPFTQVFGGHRSFRTGVFEKVTDGLLWMLDPANNDDKAKAFRFLLGYRQIGDRAYEAAKNALYDTGVAHRQAQALTVTLAGLEPAMPVDVRKTLDELRARIEAGE